MFRPKPFVAMAAFAAVNLAAFAVVQTNDLYNVAGDTIVGYKVTGLPNYESAVVFTNTSGAIEWKAPRFLSNVQFLVVAGGGGGMAGTSGAGGGGGGVVTGSIAKVVRDLTFTITVGAGGAGGSGDNVVPGSKGSMSKIAVDGTTWVGAYGGGRGGAWDGGPGGSGGGGRNDRPVGTAQEPIINEEYVNAVGLGNDGSNGDTYAGGGGGGATAPGGTVSGSRKGRPGGTGLLSDITGVAVTYGSGGGGGTNSSLSEASYGAGGSEEAGRGGKGTGSPTSGRPNTGGGGGGGSTNANPGGAGGSGIVVLRYRDVLPGFKIIVR